jgi:DNA-binding response OmpR family regulator
MSLPEDSHGGRALPSDSGGAVEEKPQPGRVVTVLSVSDSEADNRALGHLFRHTKWILLESKSCLEAITLLRRGDVPVVICDHVLPDGDWKDILATASDLPNPPLLIVASRFADDRLWADVMNFGGYDVLEKPFNRPELVRVVSMAWLAWKGQWQRTSQASPC